MERVADICFAPCMWEDIGPLVAENCVACAMTVDSFWEDHVLESKHYKMTCDGEVAGYFAVHKGSTMTLFYVAPQYAGQSQELFARAKKYESVTNAMVATGDEFFLSHCVDNFKFIEKQAYFSVYTDYEIPAQRQKALSLRRADVDKDCETLKLCGDFLDGEIKNIQNGVDVVELYIVEHEGDVVGFGVIQYGRILKDTASTGMFVREEYRRQGFAANILQSLKHIVRSKGCRAYSGCWYYNHNSKKSMESAGAYSPTRLLRFYF